MYSCGNCHEISDVGDYEFKDYFCIACKTNTCFKCKLAPHEGLCAKDKEDEDKTKAYVIECCGTPFIRGDACNKVTCQTCKTKYCWICKAKNIEYNHFVDDGKGCHLFGERPEVKASKVVVPKAPKVVVPKAPKVVVPKAPKVVVPKAPKVKEPKAPKVKEPKSSVKHDYSNNFIGL